MKRKTLIFLRFERENSFDYCKFSFRNNPLVIGQDNANVPNIVKLFADAFVKSAIEADSQVGQRMILITRHVQVRSEDFVFSLIFFLIFSLVRRFHRCFKRV